MARFYTLPDDDFAHLQRWALRYFNDENRANAVGHIVGFLLQQDPENGQYWVDKGWPELWREVARERNLTIGGVQLEAPPRPVERHPSGLARRDTNGIPILFEDVDYKGRTFRHFYVAKGGTHGPGWYVYGRDVEGGYDGRLTKLVAQPDVPLRKPRGWNIRVRPGWSKKADAQTVADALNEMFPA